MIKKIMAALFGALILATPALAWDTKDMNRQIDATNVLVNDGCSGTFVSEDTVLTAAHCVVDNYKTVEKEVIKDDGTVKKEKFRVAMPGQLSQNTYSGPTITQTTNYIYKIVKTDRVTDLGLLKITGKVTAFSDIACDEVTRGETVYAVGNSFGMLYSSLTKGVISSTNRSYRDLGLIGDLGESTMSGENGLVQHSAPIAGGNSGGALYNESGKLVGVNVRGARTGGFSFSVPLSDIRSFLDKKDCDASLAR